VGNAWDPVDHLALQPGPARFRSEPAIPLAHHFLAAVIDSRPHFFLILGMSSRLGTAVELVAFAAFIAAIFIVVMASLTFLSDQCSRGTPVLPAIFPCFQER
jgi:hypothetical protein